MESILKHSRGNWKELENTGNLKPVTESLKEFVIKDLTSKNVFELQELLLRQDKILKNISFISNLKDKGEKLKKKRNEIKRAFDIVIDENKSAKDNSKKDADSFEWSSSIPQASIINNCQDRLSNNIDVEIEEDQELNPLQLLAWHSVDYSAKIIQRRDNDQENTSDVIEQELKKLDLEDSEENKIFFGDKLLKSLSEKEKGRPTRREPFRPNRTLIKPSKHSDLPKSKMITIQDSLKLQDEAHKKEKLKLLLDTEKALGSSLLGSTSADPFTSSFDFKCSYRDTNLEKHLLEEIDSSSDDEKEMGRG